MINIYQAEKQKAKSIILTPKVECKTKKFEKSATLWVRQYVGKNVHYWPLLVSTGKHLPPGKSFTMASISQLVGRFFVSGFCVKVLQKIRNQAKNRPDDWAWILIIHHSDSIKTQPNILWLCAMQTMCQTSHLVS